MTFPKMITVAAGALTLGADLHADDLLQELDGMMQGRFESVDSESPFSDTRFRIDAPALGDHVYYYQINSGPEMKVYRQRILIVSLNAEGLPSQVALNLVEPEKFADATHDAFTGIDKDDVAPGLPDGCEQIWTATDEGFKGYVDPEKCVIISSRTGKPRGIEAEVVLDTERMLSAERGYDENGEQLFGTEPGEYLELRRVRD